MAWPEWLLALPLHKYSLLYFNQKFSDRPTEKLSNFVYMIVNNIAYRVYHLVLTVALLLLALFEFPTVFLEEDPSAFSAYQSDWLRVSK